MKTLSISIINLYIAICALWKLEINIFFNNLCSLLFILWSFSKTFRSSQLFNFEQRNIQKWWNHIIIPKNCLILIKFQIIKINQDLFQQFKHFSYWISIIQRENRIIWLLQILSIWSIAIFTIWIAYPCFRVIPGGWQETNQSQSKPEMMNRLINHFGNW
jgi:hypothetical protein